MRIFGRNVQVVWWGFRRPTAWFKFWRYCPHLELASFLGVCFRWLEIRIWRKDKLMRQERAAGEGE